MRTFQIKLEITDEDLETFNTLRADLPFDIDFRQFAKLSTLALLDFARTGKNTHFMRNLLKAHDDMCDYDD